MDYIKKYFPRLSELQHEQLSLLPQLYGDWNSKINVISRKDIVNIEVNHILHSLAIAKYLPMKAGTKVMDLGTGGGFPGIPLAIVFPDVKFHLIDRIGKKITVAKGVADQLGLDNVTFQHGDSGECHWMFDFVVSRGVMPQSELIKSVRKNISRKSFNSIPNGLIALKGGDLKEEMKGLERMSEIVGISGYFEEPFFETKKIVYTQI